MSTAKEIKLDKFLSDLSTSGTDTELSEYSSFKSLHPVSYLNAELQKAKSKAQISNNLKEEANLCNQLGELLAKNGDYQAAIEEHRQELALSEGLHDVIGCAVANRKIGECYAELGNIEAALKHQRLHLNLARSVNDATEEQRALATIGRTYLFLHDSDQSRDSLKQAEDAFKKSLAILDGRLEGTVSARELSEMRARLLLNLGFVFDGLKEPQRCSDFIRQSIYISEKNNLLEDLYRANFNLGSIHFRNGQHSLAMRCFEKSKECARKMTDKFSESECFYAIGKVLLNLGDLLAARRSLKKAFLLGSQQPTEREAVKRDLRYAIRGCQLEEAMAAVTNTISQEALGLAEGLGDLYCKRSCAEQLGKPTRELAVIHVSLAATYSDLRQHSKALEHYRHELKLREGNPKEECETWLNIASCQEEHGVKLEEVDNSYTAALNCAERAAQSKLQRRVLRVWLQAQKRASSAGADATEARLQELCEAEGCRMEDSDEEEEEEELQNSEPLDSDIQLSDSDDDLEGYDKLVTGRRKTGRWSRRNEKGETALHRACIEGNLKQVHYLVEQGHPLNPRDHCGWTPLHEACNHGHLGTRILMFPFTPCCWTKGANINDPGGAYCDGVTPLHDALSCGHFEVARLLVQRGASANVRNNKGDKPLDTLRQWLKTYGRELDQETRQDCSEIEKLLKRALTGAVAAVPVTPKPLQDSQLFDAEYSEPLLQQSESHPVSQHALLNAHTPPEASTPPRARRSTGPRHHPRGTEENVLFGNESSSSEHSDSEISPLRLVRPRLRFKNGCPSPQEACATQDIPASHGGRETDLPSQPRSDREEYHRAIQNLGSAKSRLLSQSLSEPAFSSTPAVSTNHLSALVPEEFYLQDDWLEDDLGNVQPKKKRRVVSEQESRWDSATSRNQSRASGSFESSARGQSSSSRSLSLKKNNKARQVKMSQLPGMVMLGRREVSRSPSPIITPVDEPPQVGRPQPYSTQTVPQAILQTSAAPVPAPIRMRVRVQNDIFLIPVPHSEANSCTVAWLCEQAAQRYYQTCGLLPRLSLQKEGALLSPADLLLTVLHTNEEVLAEVCSWDLPPLPERYKKACKSLGVEENGRVLRLCEVQDGSPHVCVCGLSLVPASLSPLLRALKLQSSLTELRLSANRLNDDLLPELISAATTMPLLRFLDVSANQITGEGIKKAASTLEGRTQHAFPVGCELEEKERFWSELDEVMESIPTGERVVIGAAFNGHVGEGNTGDEEVMGKFGVKERNLEGQMVVLPDDWETTAEVIRETGRKVLGVSSGRRKEDKETWWWNEEVQDSIQSKRLAKKKWDMDRTEENRQEYKELQRRVKREVSKAKQKAYDELYTRTVVKCAVGQTEEFKVEVGLHQGSALSPFLFAIVMDQLSEEVRQESPWTMMFADDIVICSESREQVEESLGRWRFALKRRGMKVSRSKTEYMCVNEREGSGTVRLQGEEVKKVQEFKYLGSTVQSNGECGKEVKKRVQAGWNGWRKVSGVLCNRKISARIKGKVYRTVVRPAMLYGLETVSLRKRQESELEVAELKMLRFSLGVTRLDRIRNEYIRGTAHVGRLGDKVKEARLRWFGHVQRREIYSGFLILTARKWFASCGKCLEELNMSMNPLGDGWSQALASLLSSCPLLATLSLQACGLTARFLQQHRLLLASALTGTGHLRSVCLSQNALGATGFELVLKTLPLQQLTHLELNAVCKGPSDQPALDLLSKLLTQGDCLLTHLGLAANGLTDQSIRSFTRCLSFCPSLVSLDLSANPSVTSAGLHSILSALGEARRPLTLLNLQGCQVCGPWDMACLESLAERVKDLRLCSQRLNKLDQEILRRSWPGRILSRNSKCLLSMTPVLH
ncbi:hypothetical protein QTP70_033122 [Hemibagrus guttatus]|uniref:Tonsoku-like protein n=1 Tax=Hemibagrus guttatus TaxID=175788 RepID=A0AAE0V6L4_9TELE|nr:hypothetical protein QTP70_033122 [Hemibagrus guttatus]